MHRTATPGRPQTNAIAERAVRTVLEGSRVLLLHAGLPHIFWPYAARAFCMCRNTSRETGDSPWKLRHGREFQGKRIPFGALVHFHLAPDRAPPSKFSPRGTLCVFLGYFPQPGGLWKGE